jgi:rfaE bifunctional protein nucleotidyltransferase chain/domain
LGLVVEMAKLAEEIEQIKAQDKTVVLCHGCFDLMHPGHIKHFQAAKEMGDVLIVTVTADIYVDKGPGRPVFNQDLRVSSIAALECVDFAAINIWPTAEQTLRLLKPNIYVKGQEFENGIDKTFKIQKELRVVKEVGFQMRFTHEVVFSSTKLLNMYFK